HETGHIITLLILKIKASCISFEITGIKLINPQTVLSYNKELIILFSGSVINIILFSLFYPWSYNNYFCGVFSVSNLLIGIFNLLPVTNFDGGKIIKNISLRFLPVKVSYFICRLIDFVVVLGLIILSVIKLMNGEKSISLYVITIYLFIALLFKFLDKE
ncbi:MAG: hypothetical protein RSE93_06410, partial [Oscillospiraceae bacterium]